MAIFRRVRFKTFVLLLDMSDINRLLSSFHLPGSSNCRRLMTSLVSLHCGEESCDVMFSQGFAHTVTSQFSRRDPDLTSISNLLKNSVFIYLLSSFGEEVCVSLKSIQSTVLTGEICEASSTKPVHITW